MSDRRRDLAAAFRELAELTLLDELDPNSFRVRAYEQAEQAIAGLSGDPAGMSDAELLKRHGIGKSSLAKLREFLSTGRIEKLEALRAKFPPGVVALSRLPGLGPKRVAKLREALGVESVADLRAAIDAQRVRGIPGFGKTTEEKLDETLRKLGAETAGGTRMPIARAHVIAERVRRALEALPSVERVVVTGSMRRLSETIGDLDMLVVSERPVEVMAAVAGGEDVAEVIAHGEKKTSVRVREGLQVDVRVVGKHELGAAMMYFTGSKTHNIQLRQRALGMGLTLNEYGLAELEGGRVVASETEADVYRALGLAFIPPEKREARGEIEAAENGTLPAPLSVEVMRGDLHVHTDRSGDGRNTLEEIAARAAAKGYAYVAITDHAEGLPRIGIGREALEEQAREMAALAARFPSLTLLRSVELNIGPKGDLDYDDAFRRSLDLAIAGVHGQFELSRTQQTDRIVRAMHDPSVAIVAHLTGRMIGERSGIELDVDAVLDAAAETGTALEINANLARLDLPVDVLYRVRDRGVLLAISSDAHSVNGLDAMRFGIAQAERGYVDVSRVVNTWSDAGLLAWVAAKKRGEARGTVAEPPPAER